MSIIGSATMNSAIPKIHQVNMLRPFFLAMIPVTIPKIISIQKNVITHLLLPSEDLQP
jgi:hypothetical protein